MDKKRRALVVMGILSILSMLTGCRKQILDGPGMERLGAELVNVTGSAVLDGYWSEDCVGYVFEIFDKQVIVRSGIVQLETEIINRNGKLYFPYEELISAPNGQAYGYISEFELRNDDTISIKVHLDSLERTDEHVLRRVDYPYSYERVDSLLSEVAGTYVSDFGEEVTIEKSETERESTGRTRHDCGYTMRIKNSREEKEREDFFLGKKTYKDALTLVNTTDFNEGLIVRKNAEGEYELVSLIIEMGEENYRTLEEIYHKK